MPALICLVEFRTEYLGNSEGDPDNSNDYIFGSLQMQAVITETDCKWS